VKLLPRTVIIAFILEEQLFERDFADSNSGVSGCLCDPWSTFPAPL